MHDVAQTILAQLGGRRFQVMTGAKQFVGSDTMLMFALPRTPYYVKDKINKVRITLDDSNTYTMECFRISRDTATLVTSSEDLYAEDLQSYFTRATGLDTHL